MRVLAAVDKFKGTLGAAEVASRLAAGLQRARPGTEVLQLPVADGGEGTLDAAVAAGFSRVPVTVVGPTGRPVASAFALRGPTAVVELAAASGLALLPEGRQQPLTASSRGTGELVRAALNAGATTVVLGIGGSASTDGGAGLLQALGLSVRDAAGRELSPGGAALAGAVTVDVAGLDPRLRHTTIVLACDVDNPLTGPAGAAAVYGPQKGADPATVAVLEAGLHQWVAALSTAYGPGIATAAARPGAGAAGGVGFAALAVLGARLRPGIEVILELAHFEERLAGVDLVITGEGSLDAQSLHGKAPVGVATAATRAEVPVLAVAGRVLLSQEQLRAVGIRQAYALTDVEPDLARCLADAGPVLEELAAVLAATWVTATPRPVDRPPGSTR